MIVKLILCMLLPTIGAQLVGPVRYAKECRRAWFKNDYTSTDDGAIGCPNGYVIHIIAGYYGEDTDAQGCEIKRDDCRIAVKDKDVDYYYKDMVDNCDGRRLCSSEIYAKYLEDGCDDDDRTDYVLIEYRCVVKEHFDNSELSSLTAGQLTGHYFDEELCPVGYSIKIIRGTFFIRLKGIILDYLCEIEVPLELFNQIRQKCDGRQSCRNLTAQEYWSTDWQDGYKCRGSWSSQYMQMSYDCVTDVQKRTREVVRCNNESFDNAACEAGHSVHIIEAFHGDIAALPESYDCPENISKLDCRVNIKEDGDYYNEIMEKCEGQTHCRGLYARAGENTTCQGDLGEWNQWTQYVVLVYECVPESTTILPTTEEPTTPSTTFPLQSSTNMKPSVSSSIDIDLTTQAMTTNITRSTLTEKPTPAASLGSRIGVPVGVSLAVLVIVAVVITVVVVLVLRRRKKSHKDTPPANAVSNQIYMSQLEDGAIPGNVGNNNHSQPTDDYAIPNKPRYAADNDLVISDNPMYASVPDPQPDSETILEDNPTYTEHMEDGREAVINEDYSNTDALNPAKQSQSGHVTAENGDVYTVPIRKQKDMEDDLVMVDNIVYN